VESMNIAADLPKKPICRREQVCPNH